MYARKTQDQTLTFDFAEGLIKNNLLFVDRETGSLWSQLHSKAVSGPLKDTPLQVVPALQTTWKHWRQRHPDTLVMVMPGAEGRPYWYRNWKPGTPRPKPRPQGHDPSNLGFGLVVNNQAVYFPFSELEKMKTPFQTEMGGKNITIYFEREALTAWAEDSQGQLLAGVLAYRDGWLDFFPDSRIFEVENARN